MNVILTLLAGVVGWRIAKALKLPAPAMLGSMIFVGLTNVFFSYATYTPLVKVIGTSLSGAYIGVQIRKKDIFNFRFLVKPFLILIVLLSANTFLIGWIFHRWFDIDWMTALLSCVAGGVTDMSIVAIDLNADAGMVAMMQTLRLIGVLLVFPYWITFLTKNEPKAEEDERLSFKDDPDTVFNRLFKDDLSKLIFTFVVTLCFGFVGLYSKVPAGSMMFPMFAIMTINILFGGCKVNKDEKLVAQIFAGSVVGCSIKASTFSSLETTLIPALILLFSYFVINFVFSFMCKRAKVLDMKSAMFASAPGGATDMTLIAADLGADLTKIGLIQSLRAAYVVSVMPILIVIFVNYVS